MIADAILVVGGGVREHGVLPPWVTARFDRALEIVGSLPILCLSAATTHRPPPLNEGGYPYFESVAGAAYLLSRGVPSERIQVEIASYDTIGNAYFAKLLHADPAGWRNLIVITSAFHLPRTKMIFEWIFGMEAGKYRLHFESTPDVGLTGALLKRRIEKEAAGLQSLQQLIPQIGDLGSLHQWIHSEHLAYSALGWLNRKASTADLIEIY